MPSPMKNTTPTPFGGPENSLETPEEQAVVVTATMKTTIATRPIE